MTKLPLLKLEPSNDPREHFEFIVSPHLVANLQFLVSLEIALLFLADVEFFELQHHFFESILDDAEEATSCMILVINFEGLTIFDAIEQLGSLIA